LCLGDGFLAGVLGVGRPLRDGRSRFRHILIFISLVVNVLCGRKVGGWDYRVVGVRGPEGL